MTITQYFITTIVSFSIAECSLTLPDYCGYMEGGIRDFNIPAMVQGINNEYKRRSKTRRLPRLMRQCQEEFNELLTTCEIGTKQNEEVTRPVVYSEFSEKTEVEEVIGVIDILTVNNSDMRVPPIAVKLRFLETACVPMAELVKFLNVESFDKLFYRNQRIILMALTFGATGIPAITEWMGLFYQNGRVVGAQQNTTCLDEPRFSHLTYKDKHLKEYFTMVYK